MRFLSVVMAIALIGLPLSACSSQVATPPQPVTALSSLDSAEAYLARGDQYSTIKDYEHAIADYTQAIRLKPDLAEAYNNRGLAEALEWKDGMTDAIADYSQAIKLRPDYAYAYNNRGVAYMASGHPDEALRDFNYAIQFQPDFPQAYSNRGNAYLRKGHLILAIIDFHRTGKFSPGLIAFLLVIIFLGFTAVYFLARPFLFARRSRRI
jgi:tetratricopeptide (TPR) repeat protein